MAFGVAEDGVLYVGVADTIRRYAPSGAVFRSHGGLHPARHPATDKDSVRRIPRPWQRRQHRHRGRRPELVRFILDRILTTADGLTFTETDTVPTAGGISAWCPIRPGPVITSFSAPSILRRAVALTQRCIGGGNLAAPVHSIDSFPNEHVAGITKNSVDVIYRTYVPHGCSIAAGLDWVLAYSTPSFRTFDNPTVQSASRVAPRIRCPTNRGG